MTLESVVRKQGGLAVENERFGSRLVLRKIQSPFRGYFAARYRFTVNTGVGWVGDSKFNTSAQTQGREEN